jgi:signal peptide peptidase SppA
MGDISGPSGTSTEQFTQMFRGALADPNVKAIVIDVDSPGGSVEGVDELASEIRDGRKKKPVTAVSNCLMASAAYYIASACSEVVAAPSSLTGSIGVYSAHEDDSQYLENRGVKITLISYGANKTEGNAYEPLGDNARAHMQHLVDTYGLMFEKAVAKGRGVPLETVQRKFGQGRVFPAQQAVKVGMADRVGTLDDVLQKYGASRGGGATSNASVFAPELAAMSESTAAHTVPRVPRADAEPESDGVSCECECDSCTDGDCEGCTHADCACKGCRCQGAVGCAAAARHAARRRQMEIASA